MNANDNDGRRAPLRCALLACIAAVALGGCATTASKDDPFEPMNRSLFEFHEAVDPVVVQPVIDLYTAVVPEFLRNAVANFFSNIDDMVSAANDLLQGKFEKFNNDMGRVMLNTFVLGGIFDLATPLGIEKGNNDFGQTFGVWGFEQGPYLFVPFFGPTTFRDGAGWITRAFVGPVGFIPEVPVRNVLYGVGYVDLRDQAQGAMKVAGTAAIDKYLFIRNAYLQRRRYLLYDGKPPPEPEDDK